MSGPRILIGVLGLAGLLLWTALAGGGDADLERGLHLTEQAFTAVDEELAAMDQDFRSLTAQSPVLGLRQEHTRVRELLVRLRNERVEIQTDPTLDRRARLPRLQSLVQRADEALAMAVSLRRKCSALSSVRVQKRPLLAKARELQDQIDALRPAEGESATQATQLAASLTEIARRLELAEHLIRQNTQQGHQFGENTLSDLRQLVERQQSLLVTLR